MRDKGRQKAGWGGESVPPSSKTEGNNIQKERMSRGQEKQKQFPVSLLVPYISLPVLLDGHWQPCERFLTYLWKLTSLFCSN